MTRLMEPQHSYGAVVVGGSHSTSGQSTVSDRGTKPVRIYWGDYILFIGELIFFGASCGFFGEHNNGAGAGCIVGLIALITAHLCLCRSRRWGVDG